MKKLLLLTLTLHTTNAVINPLAFYTSMTTITNTIQAANTFSPTPLSLPTTSATTPPATSATNPSLSQSSVTPLALGQTTQTIQTEGHYQVTSSIQYPNNSQGTCALIISQSNVVIDLNGQTIQFTGAKTKTVHGITIAPGVTNVTIQNGTISNFPGAGINASQIGTTLSNHITLQNIKIISCYHGIIASTLQNLTLKNCSASGNASPVDDVTCGIEVDNTTGLFIENCFCQNNISPKGSCYGFIISRCKTVALYSCLANGNQGKNKTAGIYFVDMLNNNYMQNCICNGNAATNGDSHGILLENCNQTFVQNCVAQCNTATTPNYFSYGIRLLHSSVSFVKGNSVDCNDYGIYDDEALGKQTNIFTQNIAYQNRITDFIRPYSSPLSSIKIDQEHLQGILMAGALDNVSIRINS